MILAIDFGLRKIGLAISEGIFATPLAVLPNNKHFIHNLSQKLPEKPKTILIGKASYFPYQDQYSEFVRKIETHFQTKLIYVDEDYSTIESKNILKRPNLTRKKRREDNAQAASIILERYLESLT
jgi:RNase H-fold protein (predicted Holliday junction resolvase)